MARKKIDNGLQVEAINFDGMFPFTLKVIYKKGSDIREIIFEAASTDINLIYLANSMQEEERTPLSMVYQFNGTTTAYMFVADDMALDTLVHESDHVVFRLFAIIGSDINEETEEFFAYIDSSIFRKVYTILVDKFNLNPPVFYEE